jgi:tetratricopeptide (TPR) repeat protein
MKKLRGRFASIQLLFAGAFIAGISCQLLAQDRLVMKNGQTRDGRVLGSNGTTIQLQVGAGAVGIQLAQVSKVVMPPPPEVKTAQQAFAKAEYAAALGTAKALVDKYRGLPADWAQQATAMLGDIYVGMNDTAKAEQAYKDFQTFYPEAGTTRLDIGMARIAVAKKDYSTASEKLTPLAEQALKEKQAPSELASGYSQVFLLLGQCKEATGDYSGALEAYLRTVTIFPQDSAAVAAAQERADAIRKEHKVTVP